MEQLVFLYVLEVSRKNWFARYIQLLEEEVRLGSLRRFSTLVTESQAGQ